jgi:phosphonoacetate hydrolase
MKLILILLTYLLFNGNNIYAQEFPIDSVLKNNRLIIVVFDGFGSSYYKNAPMPFTKSIEQVGFYKEVKAVMPTATNANNASICCSNFPDKNGITGNSFLEKNGKVDYMEASNLLLAPTIFQKLEKLGIKSALLSSKKSNIKLLSNGTTISLSPELKDSLWIKKLGPAPNIYTSEVNYWVMDAALDILKNQPAIRCLYIHTTDYPMHMWAPIDSSSDQHLSKMDDYLKKIAQLAPDAMLLITANHDVNHKDICIDIQESLMYQGVKIKMAISPERDKYLKHHSGFGGTSYIYVSDTSELENTYYALKLIKGVKTVLTKNEAVELYHLHPDRIGDFVVLGDSLTVFGSLENHKTFEKLPSTYRTHGSEFEINVPLLIYNAKNLPPKEYFNYNIDVTKWLFEK